MAIQQVGQSAVQGTLPVFYVPPPNIRGMNPLAAYMSGFLETRTPAAREKLKLELAAMRPVDRTAAIQAILDRKAAAIEAGQRAIVDGRKSSDDLAKTALQQYGQGSRTGMTQTGANQRAALNANERAYNRQQQEKGALDRELIRDERLSAGGGIKGEANDAGQMQANIQAIRTNPADAAWILENALGVGVNNAGRGQFNRMSPQQRGEFVAQAFEAMGENPDPAAAAILEQFAQGMPVQAATGGGGGGAPGFSDEIMAQRRAELGLNDRPGDMDYPANPDTGMEDHEGSGMHEGETPLPRPGINSEEVDINTDIGGGASFRTKGLDYNGDGKADVGGPDATFKASGVGMSREERDMYKGIVDGRAKYDPGNLGMADNDPTAGLLKDLDDQLARLGTEHGTVRPSPYGGLGGKLPELPALADVSPEAYEGSDAYNKAEAARKAPAEPPPAAKTAPAAAPAPLGLGGGLGEVTDDDLAAMEAEAAPPPKKAAPVAPPKKKPAPPPPKKKPVPVDEDPYGESEDDPYGVSE